MKALLIVDPQIDFAWSTGALAVPDAHEIFPVLNRAASESPLVIASRDWHPRNHVSFRQRGGPWPSHCVQGTWGAEFHPALHRSRIARVFSKGADPEREAYSAFEGVADDGARLADWLRERGVTELQIGGLATDYCVRATVLDALEEGFGVELLTDGMRAVEVNPGDGERALAEMRAAGARS